MGHDGILISFWKFRDVILTYIGYTGNEREDGKFMI